MGNETTKVIGVKMSVSLDRIEGILTGLLILLLSIVLMVGAFAFIYGFVTFDASRPSVMTSNNTLAGLETMYGSCRFNIYDNEGYGPSIRVWNISIEGQGECDRVKAICEKQAGAQETGAAIVQIGDMMGSYDAWNNLTCSFDSKDCNCLIVKETILDRISNKTSDTTPWWLKS